jgi:hypothetical protein
MFECVIIDFQKLSKKINPLKKYLNLPNLEYKGFLPALIIISKKPIIEKLSECSLGKKRIEYINSKEFQKSIVQHYIYLYNVRKRICIVDPKSINHIDLILENCINYLLPNTLLWVGLELDNNEDIKKICDIGFNSPYITNIRPDKKRCNKEVIALCRKNIENDPDAIEGTMNKINDIIEQHKKGESCCRINAKLSTNAINFLKSASKLGVTVNKNGTQSQKELTGELYVKNVIKDNNKIIYIIDIDKGSVESGNEENVDVFPTRYNFHSHPHEAYVRHSVNKAWPSLTDYLGYLKLGANTIFHCVASLEGLYVLSFTNHWGSKLNKVSKTFVKDNFRVNQRGSLTPEDYTKHINSILYEGYPIYKVEYFTWDKADTIMNVYYPKIGMSCMPTEKIVKNYKKIHS